MQFFLSFYLFYYIHTPVSPLSQANQSDGNRVAREVEFDHHLTTLSSQPVPCIVFYVPTFFYTHHKQRRKLCAPHNFRRCIIVFSCSSQFSDNCDAAAWFADFWRHFVWKSDAVPICLVVWPRNDHHVLFAPNFHKILYDGSRPSDDFHRCAVVAQLDRSFGSDPKGRRFESCQPHQKMSLYCRTATFLFCHGSCLSIHFVTMYAAILAMTDSKTDKIVP